MRPKRRELWSLVFKNYLVYRDFFLKHIFGFFWMIFFLGCLKQIPVSLGIFFCVFCWWGLFSLERPASPAVCIADLNTFFGCCLFLPKETGRKRSIFVSKEIQGTGRK